MITLNFYRWIIPLTLTVLSFLSAWVVTRKADGIAAGFVWIGGYGIALIVSLTSWMIYGLAT